ncbi:MAG: ATP-binding cassette domain-containing protein, partial [Gammaproteobacteria bacterium]|nr:ATP-binding cassette domain-containing protein [Gammaproteobacteria bacterium]
MLEIKKLERSGLRSCAFSLEKGESIVVTGPSGAGKSLLLRAIADLDPNQGEVCLDGRERKTYSACEWRRRVVYLPAESGWWAADVGAHFPAPEKTLSWLEKLGLPADCLDWA